MKPLPRRWNWRANLLFEKPKNTSAQPERDGTAGEMIVLDENLIASQRSLLESWRIHFRYIGKDIGWQGMKDRNDIIPLLHGLRNPTFFTRDQDFYHAWLRHPGFCLVFLEVRPREAAHYIRRFLRHPNFRTQQQRMGKVIRVHEDGIRYWQVGAGESEELVW